MTSGGLTAHLPVDRSRPRLLVDGLTKRFGSIEVLKQVSLAIDSHEIRAICGENGAGKSTLMKVLTGVYRHDGGRIEIDGKACEIGSPQEAQDLGIACVAQELSLVPHLMVFENIWLGTCGVPLFRHRRRQREKARDALDRIGLSGISLDTPTANLGMGQRQLVEIARMLTRNARILILDEPTANLSEVEIQQIFMALRALKAEERSIIYVTHRLGEVFDICDSVSVLRDGVMVATRRTADTNRSELMTMMLGRSIDTVYPEVAHPTVGDVVLSVHGLKVPRSVADLSFEAKRGGIVCLAGQVGSGTTESLRALAGMLPAASGRVAVNGRPYQLRSVRRARRAAVQFISDDRAGESVFLHLSVERNLIALKLAQHGRLAVVNPKTLQEEARKLAREVGVDVARMKSQADELSGGNQQKVAFGREIGAASQGVILMSEPTRGVDVGARADIYRIMRRLCDRGYTLVIASSDLEEVVGISDIVITMYRGRQVGRYHRGEFSVQRILADITHRANAA